MPRNVFLPDLFEGGETGFVGLGLPIGEIGGLFAQAKFLHHGGNGGGLCGRCFVINHGLIIPNFGRIKAEPAVVRQVASERSGAILCQQYHCTPPQEQSDE